MTAVLNFSAVGMAGTSVQYSPFIDNRLLLGTAANFGIVGNGKLYALEIAPTGRIVVLSSYDTQDSVFCAVWSEQHENHCVAGCGDGSLQLFDCLRPNHPLVVLREHQREAFGVSWNLVDKSIFCSCSWDGTIKLWSPGASSTSLMTLSSPGGSGVGAGNVVGLPGGAGRVGPAGGAGIIYQAKFSPHSPSAVASAHADGVICVFDSRQGTTPIQKFHNPVGSGECLTVDWNKYRQNTLASGGSDGVVRVWDSRNGAAPVNELRGHQLAVKNVKWSPHSPVHILSASYDMSAKVWCDDTTRVVPGIHQRGLIQDFKQHTEFVTDCDWSLWGQPGWVATTSFDSNVFVWRAIAG